MECCVFCLPLDLWLNACNECTQQQQQQQQWPRCHWAALLITSRRAAVERLSSDCRARMLWAELSRITTIINNIKWPQHHKYQLRVFYYLQLNRNAEAASPIPHQIQFHFKLSPPSYSALLCPGLPACLSSGRCHSVCLIELFAIFPSEMARRICWHARVPETNFPGIYWQRGKKPYK